MIFLIIAIIAVLYFAERWSIDNMFAGVSFSNRFSNIVVEIGEEFEVETTYKNTGKRIVPYLRACESLPDNSAALVNDRFVKKRVDDTRYIQYSLFLMPRKAVVRRFPIMMTARGRYVMNGCDIYCGDFLGIVEEMKRFEKFNEVVVLPAKIDCATITDILGGFLGDVSVRRFIMEDPVLTIGFRDYTGREPMKAISWTQTARAGSLLVKQYDYTLEPTVTVILDVGFKGAKYHALFEKCFSITRSVCHTLEDRGIKYSFFSNLSAAGKFAEDSFIPEGLGHNHLYSVLELLGRANYHFVKEFSEIMDIVIKKQEGARSAVIITPEATELHAELAEKYRKSSGGTVKIISPDDLSMEIA